MFAARGVTLVGISLDETAESRAFADAYGIEFPLLFDRGGEVSRAYVGLDANDHAVPGIVVIRQSSEIVFRQIARTKDDRLSAAQLVAAIDRVLEIPRGPAVADDYAAIDRIGLQLHAGAGALQIADRWRATATAQLALSVPIRRFVLAGAAARFDVRESIVQLDAMLGVRIPILGDLGAIQLAGVIGAPLAHADAPYLGARAGLWYAITPSWTVQLDAGAGRWAGGDREVIATFGVGRLLRF